MRFGRLRGVVAGTDVIEARLRDGARHRDATVAVGGAVAGEDVHRGTRAAGDALDTVRGLDGDERLARTRDADVVLEAIETRDAAPLGRHVPGPARVTDIAVDPCRELQGLGLGDADTGPELDHATTDAVDRDELGPGCSGRVIDPVGRLARDRETCFVIVGRDQRGALGGGEEGVVEVDLEGRRRTTEERRGGELGGHARVDSEHAAVHADRIRDFVVGGGECLPALLRHLEIVVRVVVEGGVRRVLAKRAARDEVAVRGEVARRESTRRAADAGTRGASVARTDPPIGAEDVGGVLVPVAGVAVAVGGLQVEVRVGAVALQHFVALGVAEGDDRAAAVVRER